MKWASGLAFVAGEAMLGQLGGSLCLRMYGWGAE